MPQDWFLYYKPPNIALTDWLANVTFLYHHTPTPGMLRVPHHLQEVNKWEKLSCVSKSYPVIKGLPDYSVLSLQLFATFTHLWIFEPDLKKKNGTSNWLQNYSYVLLMNHLAGHSLSTPNYMSDAEVESLLLSNFALVVLFFLSQGEGKYAMFLLLPSLCHQSAWSTHICYLLGFSTLELVSPAPWLLCNWKGTG